MKMLCLALCSAHLITIVFHVPMKTYIPCIHENHIQAFVKTT